jgi:hydroxyacylglutathione hydrolase
MKRIIKRILTGIGIIIVLIILSFGGFMIKARSEMKSMTPAETKEIVADIFSVKDSFVNLYLIRDSDKYIAVDAGNNSGAVSAELKKLDINPENVVAVFLTHSDGDHVASINLFKHAGIYLSKQEEKLINGEKSRFLFFGNSINSKDYTLIEDQQVISIGSLKIKGFLTPGHTVGSMCYLVNDKYLFTGDAVSLKNGRIDKFIELFNMDTKKAIETMPKITGIHEAEFVFTAHHGYTKLNL